MGLVRTWARWTSTALGASLLLPGAVMVVAAGVAIGGSGAGGFRALDQLVSGPGDPLASIEPLEAADGALAASPSSLIAALPPAGSATPRAGARRERDAGGRSAPVERERGGGGNGGGGGGGGQGTPGPGTGGGTPVTTPPPSPGGGVEELPPALPAPVGPIGGEVIDQVIGLGEQVLGQPRGDGSAGGLTDALGIRP